MRFDWYQATISAPPISLIDNLTEQLDVTEVIEGRGMHNYHASYKLQNARKETVAIVLAGGPNGNPNAWASGQATDRFVEVVRGEYSHRVTRCDVAEDFAAVGAYDTLEAICRANLEGRSVKGRAIVPDDPTEGRTYYMGAATSDVRARLYDKAAELRAKMPPERHCEIPEHLARLEIQVRPRKLWKEAASVLKPEQMWGLSSWTLDLARQVFDLPLERIKMNVRTETDFERAYRFMLMQYGNVIRQLKDDLGDWSSVGLQIGEDLEVIRRNKKGD